MKHQVGPQGTLESCERVLNTVNPQTLLDTLRRLDNVPWFQNFCHERQKELTEEITLCFLKRCIE